MRVPRAKGIFPLLGVAVFLTVLGACGASEEPTSVPTAVTQATAVPQATPTSPPATTSKMGGTMTFSFRTNPTSLAPYRPRFDDKDFGYVIYDSIIRVTPDMALEPMQAQSWDVSADGKTVTFHLKSGIKFHDGSDFTAQIVKTHLERIKDPETKSGSIRTMGNVDSIEVMDDLTFRVSLAGADVTFLPNMGDYLGMIVSETAFQAGGIDGVSRNPVGAGSFKFVEWRDDSIIRLERWDSGFASDRGLPYLDAMEYRIIGDAAVALATFQTGDIDGFRVDQATYVPDVRNVTGSIVDEGKNPGYRYMGLNRQIKPFDDLRVRKAIAFALDRDALVEAIWGGLATPLYSAIPPVYKWLDDPTYEPRYPYDPEESKRLLAEAGFEDGFSIGPVVWAGGEGGRAGAEAMADMLKKVGINLELLSLTHSEANAMWGIDHEAASYISHLACAGDLDRCLREYAHSDAPANPSGVFGDVDGLDALIDQQRITFDQAERRKLVLQIRDLILDNVLVVPFVNHWQVKAVRGYVVGYEPFPTHGGDNWFEVSLDK